MYRNVSIIVLFAFLASAIGRPGKDAFEASRQKCVSEIHIDLELSQWPAILDAPADENMKCFRACIMKAHGILKGDGTFNLDRVLLKIPDDEPGRGTIIAGLADCADRIKGGEECETAYEIMACIRDKGIHIGRLMGVGRH